MRLNLASNDDPIQDRISNLHYTTLKDYSAMCYFTTDALQLQQQA
jgi:hypothetical protein